MMNTEELIARYSSYVKSLRRADGENYGSAYAKDKVSRLRKIISIVGIRSAASVSSKNFFKICDLLISDFQANASAEKKSKNSGYGDYLVVVRQLYEMNTGMTAPRYKYYGGRLREAM
jgi:hypothetical protein